MAWLNAFESFLRPKTHLERSSCLPWKCLVYGENTQFTEYSSTRKRTTSNGNTEKASFTPPTLSSSRSSSLISLFLKRGEITTAFRVRRKKTKLSYTTGVRYLPRILTLTRFMSSGLTKSNELKFSARYSYFAIPQSYCNTCYGYASTCVNCCDDLYFQFLERLKSKPQFRFAR
ncbi:hypothetical protein RvY_14604-1 [Ramazzottius varieornatus]|uniref:Uncharacterized protein n=1 Tax=Ramazzottius varieornatus TaxID=947166 RepID=A0A1D1VTJ4_RAMVA|nr:hypothetical protein RvY_14604-1 [Ramazzottius varieornatus]